LVSSTVGFFVSSFAASFLQPVKRNGTKNTIKKMFFVVLLFGFYFSKTHHRNIIHHQE
jgi:hypothetical protein